MKSYKLLIAIATETQVAALVTNQIPEVLLVNQTRSEWTIPIGLMKLREHIVGTRLTDTFINFTLWRIISECLGEDCSRQIHTLAQASPIGKILSQSQKSIPNAFAYQILLPDELKVTPDHPYDSIQWWNLHQKCPVDLSPLAAAVIVEFGRQSGLVTKKPSRKH